MLGVSNLHMRQYSPKQIIVLKRGVTCCVQMIPRCEELQLSAFEWHNLIFYSLGECYQIHQYVSVLMDIVAEKFCVLVFLLPLSLSPTAAALEIFDPLPIAAPSNTGIHGHLGEMLGCPVQSFLTKPPSQNLKFYEFLQNFSIKD